MLALNGNTSVRDILTTHPETFPVFVKHGMCADCKADPPPVPLQHFAGKHCGGNLSGLIEELNVAIVGA